MRHSRLGTDVTVILLLFGILHFETVAGSDWLRVALWLVVGLAFFRADSLKPHTPSRRRSRAPLSPTASS